MGRRIGALGLVNYRTHPTNKRYKIFSFYKKEESDYFEEKLIEFKVEYEKDEEGLKKETVYLFALEQKYFSRAQKANYLVSAKFRGFIIKNSFLRYALLIIVLSTIGLAIVGYVKNKNILHEKTLEIEQNDIN